MLVALLMLGCAPKYVRNPTLHHHPQCPPEETVLGVADAATPEAAIDAAHAAISRQISSQIKNQVIREMSTVERSSLSGNDEHDHELITENLLREEVVITSAFSHNHLITDTRPVHKHKGKYRAISCLHKERAQRELQSEMSILVSEFERHEQHLLSEEGAAFVRGKARLTELSKLLLPKLALLRQLGFSDDELELRLHQMRWAVVDKATQLRAANPISISGPVELTEPAWERLKQWGLPVHSEGCGLGWELDLSLSERQASGPMGGVLVVLKGQGVLRSCDGTIEQPLALGEVTGYHSSNDELAREDAVKQWVLAVQNEQVFGALHARMVAELPLLNSKGGYQ